MTEAKVLVAGLPGSGKTTFLAALWHLVTEREIPLALELDSLKGCDAKHLNEIASLWRNAEVQVRTKLGVYKDVTLRLKSASGAMSVAFPDLSGEDFRELWERRACPEPFAQYLTSTNRILLFVHATGIEKPRWVFDDAYVRRALSVADEQATPTDWSPALAPTQVKLVDLLQLLSQKPFAVGRRRVCIVLSAWDKAVGEMQTPQEFFAAHLPLLHQFLTTNHELWDWTVVGVSAQGGDYGANNALRAKDEAERVKSIDHPSHRIDVVGLDRETNDLTRLITWLVQ